MMNITLLRQKLADKTALVIGAGGLGGFLIEHLARSGVGTLIVMDGDVFSESNLNRQLYSDRSVIGAPKARVAARRVESIGFSQAVAIEAYFDENNADVVARADIVADCSDNVITKLLLEETCARYGKTLVHGAISGLMGQVCTVHPGDFSLKKLYATPSAETSVTLSPCPAITASVQAMEIIKALADLPVQKGLIIIDCEGEYTMRTLKN